jgi:hypothetical protein
MITASHTCFRQIVNHYNQKFMFIVDMPGSMGFYIGIQLINVLSHKLGGNDQVRNIFSLYIPCMANHKP